MHLNMCARVLCPPFPPPTNIIPSAVNSCSDWAQRTAVYDFWVQSRDDIVQSLFYYIIGHRDYNEYNNATMS